MPTSNPACRRTPTTTLLLCLTAVPLALAPPLCEAQSEYNIATYAGNGTGGFSGDGGQAANAEIWGAYAVAPDTKGNIFIADQLNNRVRVVNSGGSITTVAGSGTAGYAGDGSSATAAQLSSPVGVVVDTSANLYIADSANNVIRKVTSSGTISTVAGINSVGAGYAGDGGAATSSLVNHPSALTLDSAGNLYIADTLNHVVRKIDTSGNITTFAGSGYASFAGDGGQATSAYLNTPSGLAFDGNGNLYIGDTGNHRIRKVAPDGTISTVAGTGTGGFGGDYGPAVNAQLFGPKGIAADAAGRIYIADSNNGRIRRLLADGTIETIAGNGGFGYSGDGGVATSASLNFPSGVAVDPSGKVYVADNQNNRIRVLTETPAIPAVSANGVVGVGADAATTDVAPGSWIEVYGSNLASKTQGWAQSDFNGVHAPTSLAGTSASIGGQAAFVSYVSPRQINVQVPSTVATGAQQLTVTTAIGSSAAYSLNVDAMRPLLYAPGSFKVNGNQYVLAQLPDGSYVAPAGVISGVTSRPAHPGEIIVMYGFGFGPVTPDTPAGETVQQPNTLASSLLILFGGGVATVQYAGLAPGAVGLYQFNLVVPNIPATDLAQILFNVGGVEETQTIYTAVQ